MLYSDPESNSLPPASLVRLGWSWCAGLFGVLVLGLVILVALAWLVGDTSLWWQRLSWIPAILLLAPILLALLFGLLIRARWGPPLRLLLLLALLFITSWVLGVDYGLFRARAQQVGDVSLFHWNAASQWGLEVSDPVVEDFRVLDPDILVVTNPGSTLWTAASRDFGVTWPHVARNFTVQVLSRFPIRTCRMVLSARDCRVVLIELKLRTQWVRIWAVDLPSDTRLVRSHLFEELAERLDSIDLEPPDIILGDFNVPLNSVSLNRAFPSMNNAFDLVGAGWHGTWPSEFPLWQLDQMLFGSRINAVRYQVHPSSHGAHRIQQAVIRPRQSTP